ncbi:hypothetical protein D3C79_909690 [compost metagenome]
MPSHDRPDILIVNNDGNSNVDDIEVALVDVGLIQPHSLQAASCITFLAIRGENAVFSNPLTEGLTVAVLGDGNALIIDGYNGHLGNECERVLKLMPFLQINDVIKIK